MATAKAERLLNLVIALVNAPRFRTATWIRERVAGYGDAPSEEAFFRTFERDKTELRDLGIPLQTDGHDGYRIPPGEFALPELSFTPAELAALGLAGRLWETTALGEAGLGALRKLRDASPVPGTDTDRRDGADPLSRNAVGLLQPRVRIADPAFAPLFAAVQARRAVAFDYRKNTDDASEPRSVDPWGLVSFRGRWYLVAYDTARRARRTFRLSRIVGEVRTVGRAGAVRIPADLDLLAAVAANVDAGSGERGPATVLVRPGRANGLRRIGTAAPAADTPAGWDRLQVPVRHLWDTARTIAGSGPDVVVLEPPDLRAAVIRLLTGALANAGDATTGAARSG